VNGGGFWQFVFREMIIHFDEFAEGIEKGWNFDKPQNK
jgi:hypothetical protein